MTSEVPKRKGTHIEVILAGLLKKKSPKGFLAKVWQARYVVLQTDVLLYFRKKGDTDPAGAIPLQTITAVHALDRKNNCRFDVVVGGDESRTFCFQTDTDAECDQWVATIEKQRTVFQTIDPNPVDLPAQGKFWKNHSQIHELRARRSVGDALERSASLDSTSKEISEEQDEESEVKLPPSKGSLRLQASGSFESTRVLRGFAPVEIVKLLLEGVFGQIFVVKELDTQRNYLMHVYYKSQPLFHDYHRLLKDMGAIQHPYVVKQIHLGETEDAIFAIYSFAVDQSLFVHLRQHRRLPEHVVRLFAAEVVCALSYLHQRGVVFSKLEPENIFLDEDGHVCVSDLLLCLPAQQLPSDLRTPEYNTPERLQGQPETECSDWWRLGVLIYELTVGFPPFRSKTHNAQELSSQILAHSVGTLRFPSFLSIEAQDLICRLLQPVAASRVTSLQTLQQHPFFKEIDWNALGLRQVESPPWVDEMLQNDRRSALANGLRLPELPRACHVIINVVKARGLPALKANGAGSDTFCRVTCDHKVFKTRVAPDTIKPVWEEIYYFELYEVSGVLTAEILHDDGSGPTGKPSRIGAATIALSELQHAKRLQGWYSVVGQDCIGHGEVYLSLGWVEYPLYHRILPNTSSSKSFAELFSWDSKAARRMPSVELMPSALVEVAPAPPPPSQPAPVEKKGSIIGLLSPRSGPTLNNMLRSMVSKKKLRFQEDGFDLDLSYITDRIIAMGFPSEKISGLYRNSMAEVQKFFNHYHGQSFRVFNLCEEDRYPAEKFHGNVSEYPFPDHNCPPFSMIIDYCNEAHRVLSSSSQNVVATHCLAGKGRTGLMICCSLQHEGICPTADSALNHFAIRRTSDHQGVTNPSQIRYVKYYQRYLSQYVAHNIEFPIHGVPLMLTRLRITTVPNFDVGGGCDPYFVLRRANGSVFYDYRKQIPDIRNYKKEQYIEMNDLNAPFQGDVKVTFYDYDRIGSNDKMFAFWVNTTFIQNNYLMLAKADLDSAFKDKACKNFSAEFKIELYFEDSVAVQLPTLDVVESKQADDDDDED